MCAAAAAAAAVTVVAHRSEIDANNLLRTQRPHHRPARALGYLPTCIASLSSSPSARFPSPLSLAKLGARRQHVADDVRANEHLVRAALFSGLQVLPSLNVNEPR